MVRRLRASPGKPVTGFRLYLPMTYENGDYCLPPRNCTVLRKCLQYRSMRFNESHGRERLYKTLQTDFGFSQNDARIFSSRSVTDIRRIEQFVEGIIDSLLLFDSSIFMRGKEYPLLKILVKKIMITGSYGLRDIMSMWKDFVNYILITASESETRDRPQINANNVFRRLLALERIQRVLTGNYDKHDLEGLAHLSSTRQLPAADRKACSRAMQVFRSTVTEAYGPDDSILTDLYEAARLIGRRCRKAGPGPEGAAHISMSSAGSFFRTTKEGGRAQEIIETCKPILSYRPLADEIIETPMGRMFCPKGEPRFRHWCRESVLTEHPDLTFGDLSPEILRSARVYYIGLDEAIGSQLIVCAFLSYKEEVWANEGKSNGIPVRVLAVPEPGFKARIVTTGPYWVNILQQATAHVTRAFLASHPSAECGLMRVDQAWQYLYLIAKAKDFPKGSKCLSSDLKEATDAIPKEVAKQLLLGFRDGLGILSPLYDIATEILCSNRLIVCKDEVYTASRGVLMGEPLTKTVLTLLNLSCEEIAIRKFLKVDYRHPVQVPWRAFAVGGDDHIAVGPVEYLNEITRTHLRAGSKISPTKHSVSSRFVRYCEKLLEVSKMFNGVNPKAINDSYSGYESSPFVDSVKVRLLSPCSTNIEIVSDRNVAIGKAKQLGRTLRWLNNTSFPTKWVKMVRDRFFQRMGPFMPENTSGVFWHVLLPEYLGGTGLWLEQDLQDLVLKLPAPSRLLVKEFAEGSADPETLELFKGFLSNNSYRGYSLDSSEKAVLEDIIKEYVLPMVPSMTWAEAKLLVDTNGVSDAVISSRLSRKKIMGREDLIDRLLKPFLFKEIFTGKATRQAFNTQNLKVRYANLWDLTYRGDIVIDEATLKTALKRRPQGLLYDVGSTVMSVPVRGVFLPCDLIEEVQIGLPNLSVRWTSTGVLTDPMGPLDQ